MDEKRNNVFISSDIRNDIPDMAISVMKNFKLMRRAQQLKTDTNRPGSITGWSLMPRGAGGYTSIVLAVLLRRFNALTSLRHSEEQSSYFTCAYHCRLY